MLQWDFNKEQFNPDGLFPLLEVGDYRCRIEEANEKISKTSGNPMVELVLKVSPSGNKLWSYLVVAKGTPEEIQRTNQNLGMVWCSFGIPYGNLEPSTWVGKVGGCRIKHEADKQTQEIRAKVAYFLKREKVDELPAWSEKGATAATPPAWEFPTE